MKHRLVALDLDGTLLPRSKVLTPRSRDAVHAAARAGVRVVLATGKTHHLAARYAAELGLDGPVVSLDGALVRDDHTDRTLLSCGVPRESAFAAMDALDGLDLKPFLADSDDRLFAHSSMEDWLPVLHVYADRISLSDRPVHAAAGDPHFLALLGPADEVLSGEERLAPFAENGLRVFRAEFTSKEVGLLVLRPRTDKGMGLARVASHLGISREEVAAVGDWRNDVEMLRWAGTGVAMADAHPEALAAADVVLPGTSEEDAVAAWLQQL